MVCAVQSNQMENIKLLIGLLTTIGKRWRRNSELLCVNHTKKTAPIIGLEKKKKCRKYDNLAKTYCEKRNSMKPS